MPTEHSSHQERANAIAKEVDRLFSRNRAYFLSNVEVFKREGAARKAQEKEAEETLDEACRAIATERKAVKADKATPHLTDKKRPEPGWEWRIGFPDGKNGSLAPHMVEGWMPPAAVHAEKVLAEAANRRRCGPGPNPSLATMYTLLAALHDECLPTSPKILDLASGRPLEVAGGANAGLWDLYSARLWCIGAKKGNTDRLDALETYLNHVQADLEQAAPGAARLEGKAALAQKVVNLCDQILSFGRSKGPHQPPGIVGEYETMTGPSGIMGLMGAAVDEAWDECAREFDNLARRLAQIVKALDPAYPTNTFYHAGRPLPLIDCYPQSAWQIPESERKWLRARVRSLNPGKSAAEIEAIAARSDELAEARAEASHTKPQWPGAVTQENGHLLFVSGPGLVHEFEQRFHALRLWASQIVEDAARQTAKDNSGEADTAARPDLPQGEGQEVQDETGKAPSSPTDKPDKQGMVKKPSDPAAYRAAARICADHHTHAPTIKALRRILDQHPEIRRWKPTKQRLSVHLGDWHKYLETEKNIADKAVAEAAKRPLWCCSACSTIFGNLADISSCPHCHKQDTLKPVAGRTKK
ncbi:MAG: hypothetical protein NTX87_14725 [Planctomycetota bacterium]|nr:hypothetical protein [Planctomycetota bacterium]